MAADETAHRESQDSLHEGAWAMICLENDIHFADLRHPADLIERTVEDEARQLATEVIRRVFIFSVDCRTLDEIGYRTLVALHAVGHSSISDKTLEEVGAATGRKKQAISKLRMECRAILGFRDK